MTVRVARSKSEFQNISNELEAALMPFQRAEAIWALTCELASMRESMHHNSDLIDLLRALNDEGAEYLIVGGYAFAVHGKIRATKDVDIFIGTDAANARRVWRALHSFGAPLDTLSIEDLTQPETFFIMGRLPNQIDIITTIDGVAFQEAWKGKFASSYANVPVHYIGKDGLIANKRAAARPQDRATLRTLLEATNKSKGLRAQRR